MMLGCHIWGRETRDISEVLKLYNVVVAAISLIKKSKISICQSLHVGCHRHLISAQCNLSSLFLFGQQLRFRRTDAMSKNCRRAINCKMHSTLSTSLCFPRNSITSITKHQNSLSKMQLGFLFAIMSWRPPTTSTAA